jgi:hypothetical protein
MQNQTSPASPTQTGFAPQTQMAQQQGQMMQMPQGQMMQPQGQMMQAPIVLMGANQNVELLTKASSAFRLWCCFLVWGTIAFSFALLMATINCSSNSTSYETNPDGSHNYKYGACVDSQSMWRVYSPGLAFGGAIIIVASMALRAMRCGGCSANLNVQTYDVPMLKPLFFIGFLLALGLLIWSAIYLITFNILAVVLFPYFLPCWAGCVAGILGVVQCCCGARPLQVQMESMKMVGNEPAVIVQPQFVQPQYAAIQVQPYGQQQQFVQVQQPYAQQPYGQQPYGQPQITPVQPYGQQTAN